MVEALIGLAGIVIGALLGGSGKYWLLRRDAWREARTSGLLLLAEVRALREADPADPVVSDTELGAKAWEAHRQVLAGFRQGSFPNGYRAPEWLQLARHFAHLKKIHMTDKPAGDRDWWNRAKQELDAAERLLARFENDPPVFGYVVRGTLGR
jgi:hypothetical protein